MNPDHDWIVVEIDGKIASVSMDFELLAEVAGQIARQPVDTVSEVKCYKMPTSQLIELSKGLKWEDLRPMGSKFQLIIWKKLFALTHEAGATGGEAAPDEMPAEMQVELTDEAAREAAGPYAKLMSYSDFAELCGNKGGVRAVAHAIARNPIAVIVPCHLIVPKETIDKIHKMEEAAARTLFTNLLPDEELNFGEYRYGSDLKKQLIAGL